MKFYQLSASAFADKIQVPRSSISHLLSGRNKPSLDFVLKVVKEFDEVELYWLLNGKGKFPRSEDTAPAPEQMNQAPEITAKQISGISEVVANAQSKKIERIVIFFEDGTFKAYLK